MNTFFTSDTHFGHTGVIKHANRPFYDKEEMDAKLIENWNDTVNVNDTVYHMGDFAFLNRTKTAEIMAQLNGKIHLILGNHDYKQTRQLALEWFESVRSYQKIKIDNKKIMLFHFPMLYWDCMSYGSWHLHGHIHSSDGMIRRGKDDHHDREIPDELIACSMDVGVDAHNYRPVEFEEIKKMLSV